MENRITIITFTLPHQAHLAKGVLESAGIEVQIRDELTAQVNNFYSNAIGGVKLQVKDTDFEQAQQILIESGFITPQENKPNKFLVKFDNLTSRIPIIGKKIIELRLLVVFAVFLAFGITSFLILSLPSINTTLTENSWCIEKIIYKGNNLTTNTYGLRLVSIMGECNESIIFNEDGSVNFPGINSFSEQYKWELKNNYLIISEINNNPNANESIFTGTYTLSIEYNLIKIQSQDLTILGRANKLNY